jgi:hypothetical protein
MNCATSHPLASDPSDQALVRGLHAQMQAWRDAKLDRRSATDVGAPVLRLRRIRFSRKRTDHHAVSCLHA